MDTLSSYRQETFVTRMGDYLGHMFPLKERVPAAFLMYASFSAVLQILEGWTQELVGTATIVGGATVLLLLLLLRLMDEIKDKEVDAALFPERPLPSGRVRESDVRAAMMLTVGAFMALHIWMGGTLLLGGIVLMYAWLMYRFFFAERILRNSLPLTLVTHNPIVPLMLLLLAGIAVSQEGASWDAVTPGPLVLLILQYWAMSFSWEVSRKIRSAGEENAYVTYSRIFGQRGAAAIALGGQVVSTGIGVLFVAQFGFSRGYLAVMVAGFLVPLGAAVRFMTHPSSRTSRLRPFAEAYMILVMLAGVVEYLFRANGGRS